MTSVIVKCEKCGKDCPELTLLDIAICEDCLKAVIREIQEEAKLGRYKKRKSRAGNETLIRKLVSGLVLLALLLGFVGCTASDPVLEDIYTRGKIYIWNGTDWQVLGASGGTTDHGALTGLSDDDHTQYLLADGTRSLATPFILGATSVTSTGTQFNYLNAATGTTGSSNTSLVFSTSPTLTTPVLDTAVGKGTWTASGTWTIPAVTLGGSIAAGANLITNVGGITLGNSIAIRSAADNSFIYLMGAMTATKAALIRLSGADHASTGRMDFITPNAAADGQLTRLVISGKTAIATATWSNITHSGLDVSGTMQFSSNSDLSSTADLVKMGGYDLSTANRTLAIATETVVESALGAASTNKIPIRWNGVTYFLLVTTVP